MISTLLSSSALLLALLPAAWAGSAWAPLGQNMCRAPYMFGQAVSMAQNSNGDYYLAVGSPRYTGSLKHQGQVQVFRLNTGSCLWQQDSVPVEQKPKTKSVVTFPYESTIEREGFVQVYERAGGSSWRKKGQEIRDTTDPNYLTEFGKKIKLSCDGNFLSIESNENDIDHFRVYQYKDDEWSQVGRTFDSIVDGSMSRTGSSLMIGETGILKYYELENDTWVLQSNITGGNDQVEMAKNGTRLLRRFGTTYSVFDLQDVDKSWAPVGEPFANGGSEAGYLSEDGDTALIHDVDGMETYRLKTPPPNPDDPDAAVFSRWTQFGRNFPILGVANDVGIITNEISSIAFSTTGSVVAVGSTDAGSEDKNENMVQAWFFPDDGAVTDCYADPLLTESKECVPDEEEQETETTTLTLEQSTTGGEAAGITLGTIAFILALTALIIVIIYIIIPKRQQFARPSEAMEKSEQEELLAKDVEEGPQDTDEKKEEDEEDIEVDDK